MRAGAYRSGRMDLGAVTRTFLSQELVGLTGEGTVIETQGIGN